MPHIKPSKGTLPFSLDRSASESLSKQMTDGLRAAIVSRRYKAGEVLPTIVEWSKMLGVSIRVPEAAIATLVHEGLVTAQKRIGCVVNARRGEVWNGRIIAIVPDGDHVYYHNILVGRLRARVAAAGYMFSQVTVLRKANGKYDFRQLEHELKFRPDFTLLIENRPAIERKLSECDVAFGVLGKNRCALPGCVANFRKNDDAAVPDIVAHCTRARIKNILQVSKDYGGCFDAVAQLKEFGFRAEEWRIPAMEEYGRSEGIARGAFAAFRERFEKDGLRWLPELLIFTDDVVASGALVAMLMAGVVIPGNVKVLSLANRGLGPLFPVSLTRVENDPVQHGDALADAVIAFLSGHRMRDGEIVPRYIVGESFP